MARTYTVRNTTAGALAASKIVNAGDTFRIIAGNLDVTLD